MPGRRSSSTTAAAAVSQPKLPTGVNEEEWNNAMIADAGEYVVESIVDDIVVNVQKNLERHIVNRSANPFLARKCKDALVNMIDAGFLSHDVGEPNIDVDPLWDAGEEPIPSTRDTWARGCVPVRAIRVQAISSKASKKNIDAQGGAISTEERSHSVNGTTQPTRLPSQEAKGLSLAVETLTELSEEVKNITQQLQEGASSASASAGAAEKETAVPPKSFMESAGQATTASKKKGTKKEAPIRSIAVAPKGKTRRASGVEIAEAAMNAQNAKEAKQKILPPGKRKSLMADGTPVTVKSIDPAKLPKNRVVPTVSIGDPVHKSPRKPTPPSSGRAQGRTSISRASKPRASKPRTSAA